MRWRVVHLYGQRQTGRDALGNPVVERTDLGEAMARSVPYSQQSVQNAGNGYLESPSTWVTPKPLSALLGASQAVLDGITYSVDGIADLGRMRTLSLSREKGERWRDSG